MEQSHAHRTFLHKTSSINECINKFTASMHIFPFVHVRHTKRMRNEPKKHFRFDFNVCEKFHLLHRATSNNNNTNHCCVLICVHCTLYLYDGSAFFIIPFRSFYLFFYIFPPTVGTDFTLSLFNSRFGLFLKWIWRKPQNKYEINHLHKDLIESSLKYTSLNQKIKNCPFRFLHIFAFRCAIRISFKFEKWRFLCVHCVHWTGKL